MGNGITLGMTNGTFNFGVGLSSSAPNGLLACKTEYGAKVGEGYSSWSGGNNHGAGLTTDSSKSGIKTATHNHTLSTLKVGKWYIRF